MFLVVVDPSKYTFMVQSIIILVMQQGSKTFYWIPTTVSYLSLCTSNNLYLYFVEKRKQCKSDSQKSYQSKKETVRGVHPEVFLGNTVKQKFTGRHVDSFLARLSSENLGKFFRMPFSVEEISSTSRKITSEEISVIQTFKVQHNNCSSNRY